MTSTTKKISPTCRVKFSPMENAMLKYLIDTFGTNDWVLIASMMPGRNPKQCRDRFCNYLSGFRQVGPWKPEEDELLLSLIKKLGPKWVEISKHIPERSENDVKNRWYKHLKKDNLDLNRQIILKSTKNNKKTQKQLIEKDSLENIASKDYNFANKYSIKALLI